MVRAMALKINYNRLPDIVVEAEAFWHMHGLRRVVLGLHSAVA